MNHRRKVGGEKITGSNGWFGKLNKEPAPGGDEKYLGKIRLEAATGADFSEAINIPKPDGMTERRFNL